MKERKSMHKSAWTFLRKHIKIQSKTVANNGCEVHNLQRSEINEKLCVINNGY